MTDDIKKAVRDRYAGFAETGSSCCGSSSSCCGPAPVPRDLTTGLGYDPAELDAIPDGADLGLGCGNPLAFASLRPGERVLDLGSGAGIDCFLAAKRVGEAGRVIGVDMTPEMVERARRNLASSDFGNVEFRLGEIEHLPLEDASVDVVISNCVINLVPDKGRAFAEAFRVLAPGGRLMVSDVVLLGEIPEWLLGSVDGYVACLSGAVLLDAYLGAIVAAGFAEVEVAEQAPYVSCADEPFVSEIAEAAGVGRDEAAAAAALFASVRVRAVRVA